ncbi:hypothetical protein INR49_022177 [Caranx melampygus]|nr:hypothetical protein INR49_022177 [Caranx melampygus]
MGVGTGVAAGAEGGGDISVVSPPTGASPAVRVSAACGSALELLVPAGLTALLALPLASPPAVAAPPLLTSPPSLVGVGASLVFSYLDRKVLPVAGQLPGEVLRLRGK